ncbi:MAG: aromatic amino acid ammonia-lyase [Leifsonia flava]
MTVLLGAAATTPDDIRRIAAGESVAISEEGLDRVRAARAVVERVLESGESVYGLTTRLGAGRDERIDPADLAAFQRQVVANHLGGAGDALSEDAVRAIIGARLAVLLNGGAGVREELVHAAAALLLDPPPVYALGSVGAADLTHLAALLAAITDEGFVLAPHEAAAFLSANAATIGQAVLAVGELRRTLAAADTVVALSLQALGAHGPAGSLSPYSAAVQGATGRPGATASAERIRIALAGSFLEDADRAVSVQDPLSLRTAPQVHGAAGDIADRIDHELGIELAARPENPVVDGDRMLSGGNFSAVGLSIAIESARLALAHVAAASERRTALLSAELRGFRAAGRTRLAGLSWYAAADALAEVRQLAVPVSLGATVLSGVEDVASFAPAALRLLERSLSLTRTVLAVEALHASELLALADVPPRVAPASAPTFAALATLRDSATPDAVAGASVLLESLHASGVSVFSNGR